MNWREFARRHPDETTDVERDGDGHHGVIHTADRFVAYISIGKGRSLLLAALDESLSDHGN